VAPDPARPDYYTVKEVAARYHLTEGTVRRWILKGAVRATRVGPAGPGQKPRLRVSRQEVEKLVHELEEPD
jgi:excisionase family DNA binding protein